MLGLSNWMGPNVSLGTQGSEKRGESEPNVGTLSSPRTWPKPHLVFSADRVKRREKDYDSEKGWEGAIWDLVAEENGITRGPGDRTLDKGRAQLKRAGDSWSSRWRGGHDDETKWNASGEFSDDEQGAATLGGKRSGEYKRDTMCGIKKFKEMAHFVMRTGIEFIIQTLFRAHPLWVRFSTARGEALGSPAADYTARS
jgi:hypothetical protein